MSGVGGRGSGASRPNVTTTRPVRSRGGPGPAIRIHAKHAPGRPSVSRLRSPAASTPRAAIRGGPRPACGLSPGHAQDQSRVLRAGRRSFGRACRPLGRRSFPPDPAHRRPPRGGASPYHPWAASAGAAFAASQSLGGSLPPAPAGRRPPAFGAPAGPRAGGAGALRAPAPAETHRPHAPKPTRKTSDFCATQTTRSNRIRGLLFTARVSHAAIAAPRPHALVDTAETARRRQRAQAHRRKRDRKNPAPLWIFPSGFRAIRGRSSCLLSRGNRRPYAASLPLRAVKEVASLLRSLLRPLSNVNRFGVAALRTVGPLSPALSRPFVLRDPPRIGYILAHPCAWGLHPHRTTRFPPTPRESPWPGRKPPRPTPGPPPPAASMRRASAGATRLPDRRSRSPLRKPAEILPHAATPHPRSARPPML